LKSKPKSTPDKSVTTIVDIPEDVVRGKVAQKPARVIKPVERTKTPTPASRSKAITLPKPKRPRASSRVPLFLLTEADEMVGGKKLKVGLFENPKPDKIRAYEPNDLAYAMLSTKNARYLHVDRIWPVMIDEGSALVRDERRGGWKFKIVHLEKPLMLKAPATWQLLLDSGLARKPKRKFQPSLLVWPAIKGHVEVIRALLSSGAVVPDDDVVIALLRELKV
jgi:hypothetical protein